MAIGQNIGWAAAHYDRLVRSAQDMRSRALTELRSAITRPRMYAGTGREMQAVAGRLLSDLCFIDEREDAYRAVVEELYRYGKLGVAGPFVKMFGDPRAAVSEVTSIYAEHAYRLGYLEVDDRVPAGRLRFVSRGIRARYDSVDITRGEVVADLGPPSLVVDQRVLCYASDDPSERWIFVDVWPQPVSRYEREGQQSTIPPEADPLVRTVRSHSAAFKDGLILTAFGKYLRWGPGWWIEHPSPVADQDQLDIAAQLRGIADQDPSQ